MIFFPFFSFFLGRLERSSFKGVLADWVLISSEAKMEKEYSFLLFWPADLLTSAENFDAGIKFSA